MMIMIDWVTAKLPFFYPGIISDGQLLSVNPNGEVEYSVEKRKMVTGSFDARVSIRTAEVDTDGNTSLIEFSGNPVKFLQGHNLFGSSDLLNLIAETVLKLSQALDVIQPDPIIAKVYHGAYTLSRIDLNRMFTLGNRAEVKAYLYTMSQNCRTRSQGAITKGSTVYLNKTSKRWSWKFYGKAQEAELKRNNKQQGIELPSDLKSWVEPMLRAELTLKSNELRENQMHRAINWHTIEESEIFANYAERIQMPTQKVTGNLITEIKELSAKKTYLLWLNGHDMRVLLPQNTFYRHRRILLQYDIDISVHVPKPPESISNVVPFMKTLELKPAELPAWVPGTDLLFEPRKLCHETG